MRLASWLNLALIALVLIQWDTIDRQKLHIYNAELAASKAWLDKDLRVMMRCGGKETPSATATGKCGVADTGNGNSISTNCK